MFRVVCVVVSMFAKSDFGGTNLVSVLSKLGKQGGGAVPSLLRAEEAAFQVHLPPCQPDLIILSITLPHRHLIQKARLFAHYSSPARTRN
jgi:hypothetical protein